MYVNQMHEMCQEQAHDRTTFKTCQLYLPDNNLEANHVPKNNYNSITKDLKASQKEAWILSLLPIMKKGQKGGGQYCKCWYFTEIFDIMV